MLEKLQKVFAILQKPVLARGLFAYGIPGAVEHLEIIAYVRPMHLIDVGANKGQFALATHSVMPNVRIDCFEPLPTAAKTLENWARAASSQLRIHRVALSDKKGNAKFYVTSREDSSSLFLPTKAQRDNGINVKDTIPVSMDRLDNIILPKEIRRPSLLKIDVQGGELNVLKGMGQLSEVIDFIYFETSFIELYEGQPLFADTHEFLKSKGFMLRGVANCHADRARGPSQADALYAHQV
jgi:FkbM family methyltransferase